MPDYSFLFFVIFFFLWLYIEDLSYSRKEFAFSVLGLALSFPLLIYIGNNAYINGFIFGYVFAIVPLAVSIFTAGINLTDIKGDKK